MSTTAATAAAAIPGRPMAWVSRAASGTAVPAPRPRTAIVATARPRYRPVVTANAAAITRGSCLPGSAKRAVRGATASQPMKDSIRVAAAWPRASQPWGANGTQFAARADGADPATAPAMTTTSRATSTSCVPAVARIPASASPRTTSNRPAAMAHSAARPPPASLVT
ncbi:MAG: hypothetical protein JO242_24930 [Streptosporangiaceae bacterium]|nr:hypothetical protein [Streptosporangiaceae bacterium]